MDTLELTISIIEDIREKLSNPSTYNYVKMSALIRQLLFDKNQLLLLAQKRSVNKIIFYAGSRGIQYDPDNLLKTPFVFIKGSLEPEKEVIEVKPVEYGSLVVVLTNTHAWTIKDVIRYVANKRGGVHYDEQLEHGQKSLDELSKSLGMQGSERVFSQVSCIGKNIVNSSITSGYIEC